MGEWFKQLKEKFLCLIGDHEWTSKHEEGILPNEWQLKSGLSGFKDYAKMYCKRKHCRKPSKHNLYGKLLKFT